MSDFLPTEKNGLLSRLDAMDEESKRWLDQWSKNWDNNSKLVRGELWPNPAVKPMFLANLLEPAVRRKVALLTESKPVFDVKPRKSGLQATADVLRRVMLAGWDELSIEMQLESLAEYIGTFGCGYFEIGYDKNADYGNGDITICAKDPRLMRVDPAVVKAYDLDKAQYIIEESVVPLAWVRQNFPETGRDVAPDTRLSMDSGNDQHKISWYQRVIGSIFALQNGGSVEQLEQAIPRVWLRKYWVMDPTVDKDGLLKYPGGRRIFRTGDNTILNPNPRDQQNPFFDGLFPYEMLDSNPDTDHPFGRSEVEALRRLNEALNRTGHTFVRTLIRNVPYVIADANAMSPETIQDLKELEEVVIEKAAGRNVERQPATMPGQDHIAFIQMAMGLIDMIAGLSDGGAAIQKGRAEVRSQGMLADMQSAAQILVRGQARRFESFLQRAGQKWVSRIFQFINDDRIMLYADGGQIKQFELQKSQLRSEIVEMARNAAEAEATRQTQENLEDGESFDEAVVLPKLTAEMIKEHVKGAWRLFRFKIVPGSSLAQAKVQKAGLLMQLAQAGMIPSRLVMEEAGFDNSKELMEEAAQEAQMRQALGLTPPPDAKKGSKGKK